MKIIPLVCPKCGGAINVTNKGSGVYQCLYCNTPIYFDDGTSRSEKNVNIKKEIYNYEIKEDKSKNQFYELIACIAVLILLTFSMSLLFFM